MRKVTIDESLFQGILGEKERKNWIDLTGMEKISEWNHQIPDVTIGGGSLVVEQKKV